MSLDRDKALRECAAQLRAAAIIADKVERDCTCPPGVSPPFVIHELVKLALERVQALRDEEGKTP